MVENGEDPKLRAGIEAVVTYTKNNLSVIRDICGTSDISHQAINSLNLSTPMKDAFEQIIQIISNEDTIVTKKGLAVFDNNIINDNNISALDKKAILSVSAIAKDSYLYWAVNTASLQTRGLFHIVALADLGGAITSVASGFFSGAANTGLVFGPGGLVLTYAGLAVSGAFYSSALSAISGGLFSSIVIDDVPVPSE